MTSATPSPPVAPALPKRLERLRLALVKSIPRFPNDRASRDHMLVRNLSDLMIDYVSWRARYVGERPRTVTVEPAALREPQWKAKQTEIDQFLEKVRNGEDLTPHLSLAPHSRGYAPAARMQGAGPEEKWSDKDFLLNSMGYHHFHLGAKIEAAGHARRTDEVILARVSRDQFDVIAVFDHSVFDLTSPERERLWGVHEHIVFRGLPPGTVVLGGAITTSGHSLQAVSYAGHCTRRVFDLDPLLDGPDFMTDLYRQGGFDPPAKFKPEWIFHHLDLAIYDHAKPALFVIEKGWN